MKALPLWYLWTLVRDHQPKTTRVGQTARRHPRRPRKSRSADMLA